MDLHVIVHSEVLQKVFVLESDWPLIIADFLAGEDNVWMDDIPEVTLEKCKKELKNFRFRDDFLRILEDGKSTATYVHYEQRSKVARHYHESLAHLKYQGLHFRCPQCQLNQSASGIHAPLPIRPVPPVALPFERWGIDFYGPMAETKSGTGELRVHCSELGGSWQARSAANVRTKAQAEAMRKRSGFDENTPDYYFKVGDMVKMKHHDRLKLEFKWKGPYHVVDVGHPGNLLDNDSSRTSTAECSQPE
ncbi:hypothetical protein BASA83_003725 [Batrachochytrium salamandrivorans]|nr:hypothetical protein BASA83_003725 [Batrachochytrium salamandrivorans]